MLTSHSFHSITVALFQSRAKFEVYLQLAWGDSLETDTWHQRQQPIVKSCCVMGSLKACDYRVWYFLDITFITREQQQQISVVPTLSPIRLCGFTEPPTGIWMKLLIQQNENHLLKIRLAFLHFVCPKDCPSICPNKFPNQYNKIGCLSLP